MLKFLVLLTLTITGLSAIPLRKSGTGRVKHMPQHSPSVPLEDWQVVPRVPQENHRQNPVWKADPADNRRQGTEPSRRFLVDLNTGLLKDYVGEMSRRPSDFYVPPPSNDFRQGTENSHATLVDLRTGLVLQHASEMQRGRIAEPSLAHLDEFSHGIEYSRFQNKDKQDRDSAKIESEVVAVPLMKGGWVRDAHSQDPIQPSELDEHIEDQVLRAAPVENRRQGTEPSRRFLVDLKSGLLKNYVSEMSRRPSGFYVPPSSDGFRQGTENSHATLVDVRTGLLLQHTSEMQRGRVADEVRHHAEKAKVPEPRVNPINTASLENNRRQGTEPSRRFLVDLKTGLLKDHVDEMSRKPSGFYVPPPSDGFRQGTENSHATLVDVRTGLLLQHASEMQRGRIAAETKPVVSNEFKHGIEYSHSKTKDDGQNEIMEPVHETVNAEAVWLKETLPVGVTCSGEIIEGKCYQFNPTPLTFREAESVCQDLHTNGHLAAVTSDNLHSRLVSMVTVASNNPILTWLGGVKKAQQYEWLDGSAWSYADWMPGHPNQQRGRVTCVEMFRMEASWWTSVDCNLKRASICSFPIAA